MALYHFHVTQISRGKGQSVCAAAAYRSGEKIHDSYYGEDPDYTKKGGVLYTEIMLPEHAPKEYSDRETLWNAVEFTEKNGRAQLAFSFDFALQNELTEEENIAMARKFILENFVSHGMICDVAIHAPDKGGGPPNPHVHVMVPIRPLNADGTWGEKQHREYLLDEEGNRIRGSDGKYIFNAVKTTDWSEPETLNIWRENWAKCINETFEAKGLSERVDHRSYESMGEEYLPQVHEGPNVRAMEKKGIRTDIGDWNRLVKWINAQIRKVKKLIGSVLDTYKDYEAEKSRQEMNSIDLEVALHNYGVNLRKRYGKTTGVKAMAETIEFIRKNSITCLDDFKVLTEKLYGTVSDVQSEIHDMDKDIKSIKQTLDQYEKYKKHLPIYREWYSMPKGNRKDRFAVEHEGELKIFRTVRRELSEKYPDLKIPEKELQKRVSELQKAGIDKRKELEEARKIAKEAYKFNKQIAEPYLKMRSKTKLKTKGEI